jgi:septal ring factor EnvC (AmiA/AmiB activator)
MRTFPAQRHILLSACDNKGSLPVNDFQLYLAVGLPAIAVLASLTVSLLQISAIRQEMSENLREIRADIREIRADIKVIAGKLVELDNRVTRIEERMAH